MQRTTTIFQIKIWIPNFIISIFWIIFSIGWLWWSIELHQQRRLQPGRTCQLRFGQRLWIGIPNWIFTHLQLCWLDRLRDRFGRLDNALVAVISYWWIYRVLIRNLFYIIQRQMKINEKLHQSLSIISRLKYNKLSDLWMNWMIYRNYPMDIIRRTRLKATTYINEKIKIFYAVRGSTSLFSGQWPAYWNIHNTKWKLCSIIRTNNSNKNLEHQI